jgi:AraC-like DNA-binding protein
MRSWLEPSASLREFVRWYVYEHPSAMPRRPILPVLETKLAFFPRGACRVFDYRIQGIETLAHAVVIGPQTRRWVDLYPSRQLSGLFVVFQPGGFHRLFGHDATALANYAHSAEDVVGRGITSVLDRVEAARTPQEMIRAVEGYLAARVPGAPGLHAVDRAAHAVTAAHGSIHAWTLAEQAGLGDRHFRRRFAEHAGMPPKHYAKVARFMYALSLKTTRPSLTWADVSQRAGYFDQMHLVKDFKALTAAPPSRLFDQLAPTGFEPSDMPARIGAIGHHDDVALTHDVRSSLRATSGSY